MINKKLQQQWKKGKTMKEKRRGKKGWKFLKSKGKVG
jgi:hypothetical protein